MRQYAALALLALLFAGCLENTATGKVIAEEELSFNGFDVEVPEDAIFTLPESAGATPASAAQASASPTPAATPSPTPRPTATPKPTPTPVPTPTPKALPPATTSSSAGASDYAAICAEPNAGCDEFNARLFTAGVQFLSPSYMPADTLKDRRYFFFTTSSLTEAARVLQETKNRYSDNSFAIYNLQTGFQLG